LTQEQERHLASVKEDFAKLVDGKYRQGQREHGGNLWLKHGLIDQAIEEAIDQVVYLLALKQQIKDAGVVLGERDDVDSTRQG